MVSGDYKTTKEAFVSGMTGSTVRHVNLILAVSLSSVALHSAVRTRFPSSRTHNLATEIILLVVPALLSITLFAESPGWLCLFILLPTAVLLFLPSQETGTSLPSNEAPLRSTPPTHGDGSFSTQQFRIPPLPALTTYRACMLLLTILSILAVDFPIFPRSLAKCETFGVSLMDMGVGAFVFSQGVVSSIRLLKDKEYLASPVLTKSLVALQKSFPVLVLGIVRVLLVKGSEYPEHESEYGTHWNFFITLAILPVLEILAHPFMKFTAISMIGATVALVHQISLFLGLEGFVLHAPRANIFSANKEGIVSVTGYFAIHLLGLSTGTIILPASPSYFRRQQKALQSTRKRRDSNGSRPSQVKDEPFSSSRDTGKAATELASYAIIWWSLFGVARLFGIGTDVSRRMANLPYILWAAAVNTTFLLAFLLLDVYYFPSPTNKSRNKRQSSEPTSRLSPPAKSPPLLEAINKNGLAIFLVANVATGLINLSLPTMYMSTLTGSFVLCCYASAICSIAWALRDRRIWRECGSH